MGARYMTFQELLKDEREEGIAEGERKHLVEQVKKKLAKGQLPEQIADALEESVETIQRIVEKLNRSK